MNQAFKNLDVNKQKRILNAALKEFAENGYEKGSTNQIVKNAGIGKGMLFYYFNNKKEIYLYLIDYAINMTMKKYLNLIDSTEPDFIERLKQAAQVKMKYYNENPDVIEFMATVVLTDEVKLPEDLEKRIANMQKMAYSKLYDNIDATLFRDDIDVNKAYKLIRWALDGYQNELIKQFQGQPLTSIDFDPYWTEFYEYLDVLKTSFYKK